MAELQTMIANLTAHIGGNQTYGASGSHNHVVESNTPRGQAMHGQGYKMPTKCSAIEFPRFSGKDLKGWIFRGQNVHILIDTGSNHNFLDVNATKRLECKIIETDLFSLSEADGVQWLVQLGDINWNFDKLTMDFLTRGQKVTLRGKKPATIMVIGENKMRKIMQKSAQISMLHVGLLTHDNTQLTNTSNEKIRKVLQQKGRPIVYMSKALQGRSLFWSVNEKEMYAIVVVVQKWRHYFVGRHFSIHTFIRVWSTCWNRKFNTKSTEVDG
ncbi:hypothetical protein BUALT_Bualt16G0102700 [Buddleja alternifolia]|uniref:Reverse transcriptase RNase H-like domain-containing protein n=1 Tax=Buddleja alternifolia TaxID=168488 RepID=A0AAV6WAM7_9LAMI|nr:hypothetical protein BUALT_Bualt16G0102700 [Buddleja alternifolia]